MRSSRRQWVRCGTGIALGAALALSTARPARAALPVILPRPGQIGFTIQGGYGTLLKTGNLGDEFGSGGGLAVRVRYRMKYERAVGLSFETQTLDARAPADSMFARTSATTILSGLDFYQMFNTDDRTQSLLSFGAGLAQVHYTLRDGETEYPDQGDGLYLAAGGGIERFVYRSFALDFTARYTMIFQAQKVNQGIQALAGMIFYVAY